MLFFLGRYNSFLIPIQRGTNTLNYQIIKNIKNIKIHTSNTPIPVKNPIEKQKESDVIEKGDKKIKENNLVHIIRKKLK